ncbi:MAG: ATP-binding protein [Candidatus Methanofastidiosia archaeon]
MKRSIIKIDEEKCNGCGECIPNCPEGALQVIDGKARLVSDLFCDGLGACIGTCPEGAIEVEEREAEPYDEKKVMGKIVEGGGNVIAAHLLHLKEHDAIDYYNDALEYLKENNIENPLKKSLIGKSACAGSCPGTAQKDFTSEYAPEETGTRSTQLRQWPVQMHLVSPIAPYFKGADLLLAADCVAYTLADFHKDYLKGKSLAIACPKLDSNKEIYVEKLRRMIDEAKINTITLLVMEVPCCSGLLVLVQQALEKAERKVPIKKITVSIRGEILEEKWV